MSPSARRWQALVIRPKLQLVQATQLLVTLVTLPATALWEFTAVARWIGSWLIWVGTG